MKKTRSYAMFTLYEDFHRKTSEEYLAELEHNILQDNKLKQNPIEITEKLEIIDGRHRFLIAKKHNLYLYYKVTYKSADYYRWMEEHYDEYHEDRSEIEVLLHKRIKFSLLPR